MARPRSNPAKDAGPAPRRSLICTLCRHRRLTMRLTRSPQAIRVEPMVRALVAWGAHRKAEQLRDTRRPEARFGGNWHSRNRDLPRAAGPAKHSTGHTLHSGGMAQTEH